MFANGDIPESRIFDSQDSVRGATLHDDRRRRPLLRRSDRQSASKVNHLLADAGTLGRRVEARTCTAAAATRTQVQMQPSQHGPKSAIRHDMSPCLQCTLRNRKYCVLQVRLSGAEPVHRGKGQLCLPRCGVKSLRPAMQASMAEEEVFPRNLKSGCASFCGTVLLAVIQIRQCVTDSIP